MKNFMKKFISLFAQGMIHGATMNANGGEYVKANYIF